MNKNGDELEDDGDELEDDDNVSELGNLLCCPCCGEKLMPCPFCGKPGKIYGCNIVGCSDYLGCSGQVDFGHWSGVDDGGVPAVHYVIKAWNKRIA